jgi:hypothetical protein
VTQDWSELELLGQVSPPDPAVLESAREVLWAAVAQEMLMAAGPGQAGESRRFEEREADGLRQAEAERPPPTPPAAPDA